MAIIEETKTLSLNETRVLHRSVGKKFSVQIIEGQGTVFLARVIFGVVPQLAVATDYLFVTTAQAIPTATIKAIGNRTGGTQIRYRIRTGGDMIGIADPIIQ